MMANTPKITPSSYALLTNGIHKELVSQLNTLQKGKIDVDEINKLIRSYLCPKGLQEQDQQEIKILSGQLYLLLCKYDLEA